MTTLIFPIVALIVGVMFGGEHFDARIALGVLLVLVGVAAALLPEKERGRRAANVQSWTRQPITENSFSSG
jgi:drug/metabolite transporter (DMT)-like permease